MKKFWIGLGVAAVIWCMLYDKYDNPDPSISIGGRIIALAFLVGVGSLLSKLSGDDWTCQTANKSPAHVPLKAALCASPGVRGGATFDMTTPLPRIRYGETR
jgi:hypothetical protein